MSPSNQSYLEELTHIEETLKSQTLLLYSILRKQSTTKNASLKGSTDYSMISPEEPKVHILEDEWNISSLPPSFEHSKEEEEHESNQTPNSSSSSSFLFSNNNCINSSYISNSRDISANQSSYVQQKDEVGMYFRMFIHSLQQATEEQKRKFLKKIPESQDKEEIDTLQHFLFLGEENLKRRKIC
jgi:hypothetical protein